MCLSHEGEMKKFKFKFKHEVEKKIRQCFENVSSVSQKKVSNFLTCLLTSQQF